MTQPAAAVTRRPPPWLVAAVALFVAVGAVVAWNAIEDARAANRPGVDLVYPGSVEITRQTDRTGTNLMLGSSASAEDILRFYVAEVQSRGYRYGGSTARIPTTTEDFACAWHDDNTIVRLAVLDPEVLASYTQVPSGYTTLYQWSVFEAKAPETDRPCSKLLDDLLPPE